MSEDNSEMIHYQEKNSYGTQKGSHSCSSFKSVDFAGTNVTLLDHIKILGAERERERERELLMFYGT